MSTNKNSPLLAVLLAVTLLLAACSPAGGTSVPPAPTQAMAATDSPTTVPPTTVPPTEIPPTAAGSHALEKAMLKNGTYLAPQSGQTITLQDGVYDFRSGTTHLNVILLTQMAFGDLNGDGKDDAVVLLGENTGGSGTFISLVAMLNQSGQLVQASAAYIDDRAIVSSLKIEAGQIVLQALVHQANDPMIGPSLPVTKTYQLEGSLLTLARLTSQTSSGTERAINIDNPRSGDLVNEVVQIQGSMPIAPFENNLLYHLYDAQGTLLDTQPFAVKAAEPGGPATFDNSVSLPLLPDGRVVWLELAELSMADGTPLAAGRVRLTIGTAGTGSQPPTVQAGETITVSLPTMMDETTGWAMVYGGGLVRTTDGGQTWTDVTPPNQASSAFFLDAQSAWAYVNGDPASGLLHTLDGGQTWSTVASSPPFDGYISLTFQNENDGWAEQYDVGAGNAYVTLFETHDGGATWTQVMLSTPDDPGEQPGVLHLCNICGDYFYFDAQRMLIIYGELANDPSGELVLSLSTDGGKTWQDETLPFPTEKYASGLVSPQAPVFFNDRDGLLPFGLITYNSDGSHGIDVTTLYATTDGGSSWTVNPSVVEGAGGSRTSIHIITPQDAFVPCGKDLCATHDGGGSWQALGANLNFTYTSDAERYVMQFQFISPLVGWATTDLNGQSGLWHTTDGGKTWVELMPVMK